jgi:hypothetical protein
MDYYVPSILIVAASWVTFWLDPNAYHGRTTLGKLTVSCWAGAGLLVRV